MHQNARSNHRTPFTLIPVIYSLATKEVLSIDVYPYYVIQGILTLWKGVVSNLFLKAMTPMLEMVIGDCFGWPR